MGSIRPAVIGMGRVFGASLTAVSAFPIDTQGHHGEEEGEGTSLWVLAVASMVLVLLGGAFAGLTIALMGQDSIYLQVLSGQRATRG
jgi:metal transporter CNNM